MSRTNAQMKDGRVEDRLQNYTKFWKSDLNKEQSDDNKNRLDQYTDVVNGFYDGATALYEFGWGKSFHFSRFYPGEEFYASLARHEYYLASKMSLQPGMRVLDVGCGVGGPARQIATFADVNVVGLNNNPFQVGRARHYTQEMGLEKQVQFVTGDFMKLTEEFGENAFDAVYAIEATVHAPTWEGVYGEILKVLKPGGVFGVYEWCMTDEWDPSIPKHKSMAHQIEVGNGIPEMRPMRMARAAMEAVGFEIEYEEDLAARGDAIPWYYPLEGDPRKAQTLWDCVTVLRVSWTGRLVNRSVIRCLEWLGIAPRGTFAVSQKLEDAVAALVAGGQAKLFTPMYLMVSRKPKVSA